VYLKAVSHRRLEFLIEISPRILSKYAELSPEFPTLTPRTILSKLVMNMVYSLFLTVFEQAKTLISDPGMAQTNS